MTICGLFLSMVKRCFCLFFSVFILLWFVFGVSGKVATVVKLFVFPSVGGFVGLFILVFGVWKVLVFLCFLFFVFL